MDILLAKETLSTKGCFQSAVVVACLGKHSHLDYVSCHVSKCWMAEVPELTRYGSQKSLKFYLRSTVLGNC